MSSAIPATALAPTWGRNVKGYPHPDAFSALHPRLNLLFFLSALVWTVLLRHPAYVLSSLLAAAVYYRCLAGRRAWRSFGGLAVLMLALTALNPLFNPRGEHCLFTLFGRAYTLESLCFGAVAAGMFAGALLWFFCYQQVVTEDKLTAVFRGRFPALSLLLVMVLRLVPSVGRRAKQISSARRCIGLGSGSSRSARLQEGMTTLSALSSALLEGSVVTADSMSARGYGTGPTTGYLSWVWHRKDIVTLALVLALTGFTALGFACGGMQAEFFPRLAFAPLRSAKGLALLGYALLLWIPTLLHLQEELKWHFLNCKT